MSSAVSWKLTIGVLSAGIALFIGTPFAISQGARSPNRPTVPPNPMLEQPLGLISGKVLTADGTSPGEHAAIESLCNGSKRRQGYSDPRGNFQFQMGQDLGVLQDANEDSMVSRQMAQRQSEQNRRSGRPLETIQCELRAILPGYYSSTLTFSIEPGESQNVGTLVLTPLGGGSGSVVSLVSLQAPQGARADFEKGEKELAEKKLAEAEKHLDRAVHAFPGFAAAWFDLGMVHEQQGNLPLAAEDYGHAQAADTNFVSPYFGLGMIAIQQKNWKEAARLTARVLEMNPNAFTAAYFYNALANFNLGNLEPAEASLRKFLPLDNDHRHPESALVLGEILVRRRDYAGAAEQARNYLKIAPNAANVETVRASLKRLEDLSVAGRN